MSTYKKVPDTKSSPWCVKVLFSLVMIASPLANAFDAFYIGGFLGVANTDLSGFGTKPTYGFRGGARLGDKLTTGLYYQVYSTKVSDATGSADIYIVPLLIELNFHLLKAAEGPFFSLKIGGIRHSAENITAGFNPAINSASDFSIGVGGGYNLELIEKNSVYFQIDSFTIDSRPHGYGFFSIVAGYTLEL